MEFESYVLTLIPDVCTRNGKDVKAKELLEVMSTYGKVEPLKDVEARISAPLKATIDNLVKQNEAIKENELDDFDMTVLRAAREAKQRVVKSKDMQISELQTEIKGIVDFNEKKQQELTAFITAFAEKYIDK
jgi:hypothetical protein